MPIDSIRGVGSAQSVLRERPGVQKPSFQDGFEVGQFLDTVTISSEARRKMNEVLNPLLPAGIRASSLEGVPGQIAQKIASAKSSREALVALDDWEVSSEEMKKSEELGMLLRKNI